MGVFPTRNLYYAVGIPSSQIPIKFTASLMDYPNLETIVNLTPLLGSSPRSTKFVGIVDGITPTRKQQHKLTDTLLSTNLTRDRDQHSEEA